MKQETLRIWYMVCRQSYQYALNIFTNERRTALDPHHSPIVKRRTLRLVDMDDRNDGFTLRRLDRSDQSICWTSLGGPDPPSADARWIEGCVYVDLLRLLALINLRSGAMPECTKR